MKNKHRKNRSVPVFFPNATSSRFKTLIDTKAFHHRSNRIFKRIFISVSVCLCGSAALGEGFHADIKALGDGHMPAEFGTTQKTNTVTF